MGCCKYNRKKSINRRLQCTTVEDDAPTQLNQQLEDDELTECEPTKDGESTDSDEDSGACIIIKSHKSETDVSITLCEQIDNLKKQFLNEDQNTVISEKIYHQFRHLLTRTLEKIKMLFIDYDIDEQQFDKNVKYAKNIFAKRQKQLQRLIHTTILSNYDYYMLEYETILQQRTSEYKLSYPKEQSFAELKASYSSIFDLYIRQCVRFHSTLNVNGICGDFDEFVEHVFGQKISVEEKEQKALELSFAHFDIPLENPQIVCRRRTSSRQNPAAYFLPSQHVNEPIQQEETDVTFIDLTKSIRNSRWTVLLGSAGSGKTTFARWLICQFARALFIEEKSVTIHDIDMGPVRIPILIRIGEFAQWLENYPSSSLLDYIGQNTWYGQEYVNGGFEILKDFVQYGHALIILDGLDEVATIELHNRVVALVRVFIQSHCMSHEFVSPFDDTFMTNAELQSDFRREGLSKRNIVLITSRILNYTTHPLNGELITHYTIQPMNIDYLRSFVENWCSHVQDEIIHLFVRNVFDFKEKKIKCQSSFQAKILMKKIETDEGLRSLVSNPSVLSIICTLFARHGVDTLNKTRVQLYEKVVELMLQRWQYHQINVPKDALVAIFSNMAFYIHSRSGSGLIDEFDLKNLCRLSLQRWYNKNTDIVTYNSSKIRQRAEHFIQLLSEDAGIVAARALGIYGFLHLTFQEYFVCNALLYTDNSTVNVNIKELVVRFLSLFSNPRLREPLNLAMGWISLHWSSENYDDFCTELLCKTNPVSKHVPLGSLWFVSAINDLACLPSLFIVYNILDALLDAYTSKNSHTNIFEVELRMAFDRLPIALVNSWFDRRFSNNNLTDTFKMVRIIYDAMVDTKTVPQWITSTTCEMLWKQIGLFNEKCDIYVDRILTIISARDCDRLPTVSGSIREYLLSRSVRTAEIHSSVLTAIVALYGGLEINHSKTKRQTSTIFAARRIHRNSGLSSLFIEYMEDTVNEQTVKLNRLIDQCQKLVATATTTNITPRMTHSLIVLFCFYNNDQSSHYEQYIGSEVWQQAIRHMNVVLLYLREFFCINPFSKFKSNLTDIFQYFAIGAKENILHFIQAATHVYCELLRSQESSLVSRFTAGSFNPLIVIKMPQAIKFPNMSDWSEDELVRLLPFICCVGSSSSYSIAIEELEAEDLKLLKGGMHPFQLLQNKPIILLLGYVPSSVQSLYMQLFAKNQISSNETSFLPFLHLLTEFLCVMLTKQTFSIRFWVLFTILLPTIVQHKMENFILRFIRQKKFERGYKYFCKAYKDNYFHPFVNEIEIGDFEAGKRAQELAVLEEQNRITHAQTDLQLYAASCCLARLTDSLVGCSEWEILEIKFNELWTIVQAIKQPVWRLDTTINICCILFSKKKDEKIINRLKDRYLTLLTWLKELEPIIPLLTYVALFVRCMSLIGQAVQLEVSWIYNILQRLKTVTIVEQQAICEALISFPALKHDISQYVRQTQHLENAVKLSQIFQCTSINFLKYLSAKSFLTSDIKKVHSTLLSSMYLSELHSYVKFLDNSVIKEKHHCINDPISQSLTQKCLKALREEPVQLLTVEAASMVSALLSSHFVEMENVEIIRIEQALANKTRMIQSASSFVLEWLSYRSDKQLCFFAHQGTLLLALSNVWTPTIVEVYCQLLSSDYDHFQDRAKEIIRNKEWHSEMQSNNVVIKFFDQWNKKKSKWLSEIEDLFGTLDIQKIDEIKLILQLEHDRLEKSNENQSKIVDKMNDDYEVSFFRLIKSLSAEVEDYLITTMQSLLNCLPDSIELLFLYWLLQRIQYMLLENNQSFIDFLIGILSDSNHNKIKVTVAKKLYYYREKKQVKNVLWSIVMNNEQEGSDELVAMCIWSLFISRKNDRFMEKRLKELEHIREHSHSSLIRQAALSAMYSRMIIEQEKYHIVDVYYSHMTNAGVYNNFLQANNDYEQASSWIVKHASILLPQFIDDMYNSFHYTSVFRIADYVQVARQLCKEIPKEFRTAVRQSSTGESAFRKDLYEMSKRIEQWNIKDHLFVYACFEQVSVDYVLMYLETKFDSSILSTYFEQLKFVTDYQSIEILTDTVKSSLSLRRRCTAAELLVHLTLLDQVSATEVQNMFTAAIDDPYSQQYLDLDRQTNRADWKLRTLLIQLMVTESNRLSCGATINMLNETSENRIPAAVFQRIS